MHLVEGCVKVVGGEDPTKAVWKVAAWMRSGNNLLRTLGSTLPVLEDLVDIIVAQPPEGAAAMALEVSDFVKQQHDCYRRALVNDESAQARRAREKYHDDWQTHLAIWTRPFEIRTYGRIDVYVPTPVVRQTFLRNWPIASTQC